MAGQPPYYTNAQDMQKEIDAYFELCANTEKPLRPTVTGLALALGFASRQSLLDYEEKGEFSYTVKKAKLMVENFVEQRLYEPNATGCIFNLKNNFGWKDKTEIDQTNTDKTVLQMLKELKTNE